MQDRTACRTGSQAHMQDSKDRYATEQKHKQHSGRLRIGSINGYNKANLARTERTRLVLYLLSTPTLI
eukprot:1420309-Prymnesium_polylepis.1